MTRFYNTKATFASVKDSGGYGFVTQERLVSEIEEVE